MKKTLSGLVAVCLLLSTLFVSSCKKDDKKDQLVFTINGVSDQTYTGSVIAIPLQIGYTSGTQEAVTMSVSGLPSGMTGTFSSQSGTPSFATALTLTSTGVVTAGSYVVTITGTSASGVKKSASMKLTVPDDCANYMTGKYLYRVIYEGSELFTSHYVATKSNVAKTLTFTEVGSSMPDGDLVLNCDNNTCYFSVDASTKGVFSTSPKTITLTSSDGSTVMTFTQE